MPNLLQSLLFDQHVDANFSDHSLVSQWIDFEYRLASIQGTLGIIPADSADAIKAALYNLQFDTTSLTNAMQRDGMPIAELVQIVRQAVGLPHGDFVHYGTTTQDVMDTAMVQIVCSLLQGHLEPHLSEVIGGLAALADQHRSTLMVGRTHSQQALPTTFGLKVANWLTPLLRQRERLAELLPRVKVVQFGGAAGTLAALGHDGLAVQKALAEALDLAVPAATWHAQRDGFAEVASWCSILTGMLAKMAQDMILLAQSEVAELRESADSSRGGSSTMPQKNNPMVCEAIIAIHRSNVGHLSTLHNALIHEHERATGSWQVEWLALQPMLSLTASALEKALWLTQNIAVDAVKMRANIAASNGLMLAEAATFALAKHMSRAEAKQHVKAACQTAASEKRHLIDILQTQLDVPIEWATLRDEANYLGMTDRLIDQVLAAANEK